MKTEDIKGLSDEELNTKETEARRELWRARFDNFANQLDDTSKIGKLRRDIARMKTIRTQRAKDEVK